MINLYFYRPQGGTNFGDELNASLIPSLFNIEITYTQDISKCNFLSIGSILQMLEKRRSDAVKNDQIISVWGSGFMTPVPIVPQNWLRALRIDIMQGKFKIRNHLNFYAVRGEYTKSRVIEMYGEKYNHLPIGDPGLLVSRYYNKDIMKKHRYGFIPHLTDINTETSKEIMSRYEDIVFIDFREPVDLVLEKMLSCETIISSAMHGLVVADSLGIPNMWLKISDNIGNRRPEYYNYKFYDYYSALNLGEKDVVPFEAKHKQLPIHLDTFIKENYKVNEGLVRKVQDHLIKAFTDNVSVSL